MSATHLLRSAYYVLETALLAPGIIVHESAHVLACRATGVTVTNGPVLNPFGADAYVDHERVESFPVDVTIAVAPLVVNTVLALVAFSLAQFAPAFPLALPCYWLGVCFGLTAFPSAGDTETLFRTARTLPRWGQPLGYTLAVPLRGFTKVPGSDGVAGFVWTFVCFGASESLLVTGGALP